LERLGFTPDLPTIYVTGGARGASPINQRIAAILPKLLEHTQVLHQTGPASANADARKLEQLRASLDPRVASRYKIVEFVGEELPDVYAAADLVIGRAGAGTISELALVGKPAILIPLPGTGGNEQAINAAVLGDAGAAVVLPQAAATPERLLSETIDLLEDPARLAQMAKAARMVARPDAASRLADEILALAARQFNARHR
jgi:UDP-N-acetylglucosamine--N-acetylmuramyl-(pentapeptide) pyrophosphoryl-undecaprenol N-acetylglucosamine transferase